MDSSFCQLCGSPLQREFCVDCGAHRVLPRDLLQAYSAKPALSGSISFRPFARLLIALVALPVVAIGISRVAFRSGSSVSVDQAAAIADERAPEESSRASLSAESDSREHVGGQPRH